MTKPIEAQVYRKKSDGAKAVLIIHREVHTLPADDARKWKEQAAKDFGVTTVDTAETGPTGAEWQREKDESLHTPASLKEHIEAENASSVELLVRQLRSPMGVVPFVGAGLSIPFGFDSWERVLRDTAQFHSEPAAVTDKIAKSDFIGAAALLQRESADRFQAMVAYKFGRDIPLEQIQGEAVALLPMLATGPVITTNFDHVIETAFVDAGRPFGAVITGPQPDSVIGAMHRNEHALIKIHGDARDRSARVFTEQEYDEQYTVNQPNRANLAKLLHILFTNRPLLFLGCSLDKDKTLEVLERIHANLPGLAHYGVLAAPYRLQTLAARRLELARYGIFPLWYVPGDYGRIRVLLEELIQEASTRLIWKPPATPAPAQPAAAREILEDHWPEAEWKEGRPGVALNRLADRIVRGELAFLLGAGIHIERRLTARTFYESLARDYDIDSLARADIVQYMIDREGRKATWNIAKKKIVTNVPTTGAAIRFIASLPRLLGERDSTRSSGQWVLTTNYDTLCEQALEEAGEPIHVLYYQADGPHAGLFFPLFTGMCTDPSPEAAAEMKQGIGSGSSTPPDVTRNHGREGADARGDRNTHPASARLQGDHVGGGRRDRDADPVGAPEREPVGLLLRRLRGHAPGRPQLAGAAGAGFALGHLAGMAGGRCPSPPLSPLWGPDRADPLAGRQGALHGPVRGGGGPGV
jgi:SIR2-like domain